MIVIWSRFLVQCGADYDNKKYTKYRKYDHLLEGINSFKWLKVEEKWFFNECALMYTCLHKKFRFIVHDKNVILFDLCIYFIVAEK